MHKIQSGKVIKMTKKNYLQDSICGMTQDQNADNFLMLNLYMQSGVDCFFHTAAQNRMLPLKNKSLEQKPSLQPSTTKMLTTNNQSTHLTKSNNTTDDIALKTNGTNQIYKVLDSAVCDFESLCSSIKAFDGCNLKKTAINTVIFDGIKDAKIMVVGEAPGANEDEQGIPFCGQSGKLLDNILSSINLDRKTNVLITNTVFWRPPGNRRPTPEEIDACRPFIEKMISIVSPQLLILVGSTAVESLLSINAIPMSTLRKKIYSYTNQYLHTPIDACVILHPSYLLRQPAQKKSMWFDVLKMQKLIKTKLYLNL